MILVKDVNSGEDEPPKLLVSTRGYCFLCLEESPSLSSGYYTCHPQTGQDLTFSSWNFFNYLEVHPGDLNGVINLPPGVDGFSVQICSDCGEIAERLGRLVEEIEEIQRKMSSCLVAVEEIIERSEEDPRKKEEIRQRLEQDEDGGVNRTVVEILRRVTKDKCLTRLKRARKAKIKTEPLEEPPLQLEPPSIEPLHVTDLQTEWPSDSPSVPEVDQEISISLEDSPAALLFSTVPDSSLSLPPPPPPTLPQSPKKAPKPKVSKKKLLNSEQGSAQSPPTPTGPQCPIDFYFHRKVDNRHACPFCTDTSPTLTNLRFHVIRAHAEQLFHKDPHIPDESFKSSVELMLFQVTKSAETGERNPSGTKVIVKCQFCEDAKVYHDKRAFQCHLILNHYSNLTSALTLIQSEPLSPQGPSDKIKRKSSPERKKIKKDPATPTLEGEASSPKSQFVCEHCGKVLSSSTSKWRHKTQYCDVLRSRGEIPLRVKGSKIKASPEGPSGDTDSGFSGAESGQCSPLPSVYLITPQGAILSEGGDEIMEEIKEEVGGNVKEEDLHEFTDFNEFYDEEEVNNVLTMMMTEDPLHT